LNESPKIFSAKSFRRLCPHRDSLAKTSQKPRLVVLDFTLTRKASRLVILDVALCCHATNGTC
jgi:hypothetical protein